MAFLSTGSASDSLSQGLAKLQASALPAGTQQEVKTCFVLFCFFLISGQEGLEGIFLTWTRLCHLPPGELTKASRMDRRRHKELAILCGAINLLPELWRRILNQHWEEREIARRESQSPGFQKKVQTLSSKVNRMELRSGIKDKFIRDVLKDYFGLDKLRDLVMF